MNKSKFTYPKCPYCKSVYEERLGSMNYALLDLARFGDKKMQKLNAINVIITSMYQYTLLIMVQS